MWMSENLTVLDPFVGLGGAMSAFRERGHDVITIDRDECFQPTICKDLFDVKLSELQEHGPYDLIWGSFPCPTFSMMAVSTNWQTDGGPYPGILPSESGREHRPKRGACYRNIALVEWTVELIRQLEPRAFILENPSGMAKLLEVLDEYERRRVTYCQYGLPYQKPTDLWGGFPPPLDLREPCGRGDKCHESAPRGSEQGLQGVDDRPVKDDQFQDRELSEDAFASLNEARGGRRPDETGDVIKDSRHQDQLSGSAFEQTSSTVYEDFQWPVEHLQVDPMSLEPERRKSALRSLVPYELSLDVCKAVEEMDGEWFDAEDPQSRMLDYVQP